MEAEKFVKNRDSGSKRCSSREGKTLLTHGQQPSLTVTAVPPSHPGTLKAWACDGAEPLLPFRVPQSQALVITLSLGATHPFLVLSVD